MIRHIVMFKFLEEADGRTKKENLLLAKEKLEALELTIDYIKFIEVGINGEEASKDNYDLVLTIDFDTYCDLNNYIIHPEHKKVGEFIGNVRESRACVDYII